MKIFKKDDTFIIVGKMSELQQFIQTIYDVFEETSDDIQDIVEIAVSTHALPL